MIECNQQIFLRTPTLSLEKAYQFFEEMPDSLNEGIYLSSPDFYRELNKIKDAVPKDKERLEMTRAKYQIRNSSRCTPYGTFAGCALLNVSDAETKIVLGNAYEHKKRIRVDTNYISEIINSILSLPNVRKQIKVFPNNSLYELSDSFRYVEYYIKNNIRNYTLTSIRKTGYLKRVLKLAEKGVNMQVLVDNLEKHENVNEAEAKDFISELYNSEILIADLEPCVTGKEPLDRLVDQLESFVGVYNLLEQLKKIQNLLKNAKTGLNGYKEIESELKQINEKIAIPKDTLQTDLYLNIKENKISKQIIVGISEQIEQLMVLSFHKNTVLETFKNDFIKKFESQEIPLSIALDAEFGIGYGEVSQSSSGGSSLINDLNINHKHSQLVTQHELLQQFVLFKYSDFIKSGKEVIEINDDDLIKFKIKNQNLKFPKSFYLLGALIKNESKLNSSDYTFDLFGIASQTAAKLLSRFAHGDKSICDFTKNLLKDEEKGYPEAIYAEIAHLPQTRITNVMLRPILSDYEIPYVGQSGADKKSQIPISDILVTVRNNEVILLSKKLKKRIIPRHTTAHNFSLNSLPVYQFLCDLQFQGLSDPNIWNWGTLSLFDYLPRVIYKNIVLKKAQWKINEKNILDIPKQKGEYLNYFLLFRKKFKIPVRTVLVEGDNKLLIDFGELMGINLFLYYLKRDKSVLLEEFLFTSENCVVRDLEGLPYTNELIIPLMLKTGKIEKPVQKYSPNFKIKRNFLPNSEWLYFKIYCGHSTSEQILKNSILKFLKKNRNNSLFEKFFFVRYNENGNHLRIRFYNSDFTKQPLLQQKFLDTLKPLISNNLIEKIVVDTYSRELERYGGNLIEESESIFYNDSLTVVKFIAMLPEEGFEKYRMLFALRGIDILLDDFNFSISNKKILLKHLYLAYYNEFGEAPLLQKQLNEKYRKEQTFILSHMNKEFDAANDIEDGVKLFHERSKKNKPIAKTIILKLGNDFTEISTLLVSYIHMFMNRLFISNQRKYELVIYLFLERYYTSQEARSNNRKI